MIAGNGINITEPETVMGETAKAADSIEERVPGTKKKLAHILQVMLYAHSASRLRISAEEILAKLK